MVSNHEMKNSTNIFDTIFMCIGYGRGSMKIINHENWYPQII
jgi:hypothetical protein